MLKVSVAKNLKSFMLDAEFSSDAGITALLGRSGAGKTTLVNAIAGLQRPDRGRIEINGVCLFDSENDIDVPIEHRRIGYVFQDGRLFPHMTVRSNLMYGYGMTAATERYATLPKVVELLGLEHVLERRPGKLSGGEKQRVAIGRALLASPRVLLMDEPLASLDGTRKNEIIGYVERLHNEIKVPIIFVTHSIAEIRRLADAVVLMAAGKVLAVDTVDEIVKRPEFQRQNAALEDEL